MPGIRAEARAGLETREDADLILSGCQAQPPPPSIHPSSPPSVPGAALHTASCWGICNYCTPLALRAMPCSNVAGELVYPAPVRPAIRTATVHPPTPQAIGRARAFDTSQAAQRKLCRAVRFIVGLVYANAILPNALILSHPVLSLRYLPSLAQASLPAS